VTLGERLAPHGLVLPAGHTLVAIADRPELRAELGDFNVAVWPEFMLHDAVANTLWDHLYEDFAAFQLCLLGADGRIVAGLNAAPLAWDGTDGHLPDGWDDQFRRAVDGLKAGVPPDTLGAIQIVVRPDRQGSGYSSVMLAAMRANAAAHGFRALIACVRPTGKVGHARVPIEEYAAWTRDDGLPRDPWIRVHVRAGGRVVRPSPASMTITGTVAEWREWTGLEFATSGAYVPEGAAAPVEIDLVADRGVYHDPNVWVVHDLE
jgi:GNAT superfamily N-acetyltransferase